MMPNNTALRAWVEETARLTQPDRIYWVDGSEEENQQLTQEMLASGMLERLNSEAYPNCFLHRSDPSDVARTEHLTFICTPDKNEVGPTNHWMEPQEAKQ